jgi:hypothetical protein
MRRYESTKTSEMTRKVTILLRSAPIDGRNSVVKPEGTHGQVGFKLGVKLEMWKRKWVLLLVWRETMLINIEKRRWKVPYNAIV